MDIIVISKDEICLARQGIVTRKVLIKAWMEAPCILPVIPPGPPGYF